MYGRVIFKTHLPAQLRRWKPGPISPLDRPRPIRFLAGDSAAGDAGFTDELWRLPPGLRAALSDPHMGKLDALRGFSALLVVYYHFGLPVPAGFGVMTFFVLSGFLITWLLLKEERRSGTVSLRDFYARRALRIFPAFYCYWFLVTGARLLFGKTIPWGQAWSSFFYVSNYYQGLNGYPSSAYSHTWSLAVEEQFYLLFPPVFLVLGRRPELRTACVAAGIVLVWILRLIAGVGFGVPESYLYTAFEMRADHLLIGCLVAMVLYTGRAIPLWRRLADHPVHILLFLALLTTSNALGRRLGTDYRDTVGNIVDPICIALLIPTLLSAGDHPSVRWLDHRFLRWLGSISYPIYLYQQVVIWPVANFLRRGSAPEFVVAVVVSLSVIAAAAASYRFVEQPFLRMKHRFSPRNVAPL